MTDAWREGARVNDPRDECPGCGAKGCVFASDFRKFGRQSVRVCVSCKSVYVNGKREGDLAVGGAPEV